MKISIECFLLDNTLMNYCVFAMTAAWIGVRVRFVPLFTASLLGAVYALVSLFFVPILREPYIKVPAFLLGTLPLYRKAGPFYRTMPFLLFSAATVGGSALMLTLMLGGSVSADGTLIGTVPIRAALLSAFSAICMPRIMRALLRIRKRRALHTTVLVELRSHTYELDALIDSGNLLTEPISGLPVLLIDRGIDAPTCSIPFYRMTEQGMLSGERPQRVTLTGYGYAAVDCICAQAPAPIKGAQAILPETLLPQEWRTSHDSMDQAYLGTSATAAARWQTRYLLVHSYKRRAARTARSGGGGKMR